jgi:hypothetical protein
MQVVFLGSVCQKSSSGMGVLKPCLLQEPAVELKAEAGPEPTKAEPTTGQAAEGTAPAAALGEKSAHASPAPTLAPGDPSAAADGNGGAWSGWVEVTPEAPSFPPLEF